MMIRSILVKRNNSTNQSSLVHYTYTFTINTVFITTTLSILLLYLLNLMNRIQYISMLFNILKMLNKSIMQCSWVGLTISALNTLVILKYIIKFFSKLCLIDQLITYKSLYFTYYDQLNFEIISQRLAFKVFLMNNLWK